MGPTPRRASTNPFLMLAGANSKPSVLPRLRAPDAQYSLWPPTIRASAVASVGRLSRKTSRNVGIPAPVAVNWTAITTRLSTFFWLGSSPQVYGPVEAPRFSAGVLHA